MQKTIHFALFLFIVTGLLFTGCAKTPEDVEEEDMSGSLEESVTGEATGDSNEEDSSGDESAYEDGTYTEVGSYQSPAGKESISVTLSLKDGVIESVKVSGQATNDTSKQFQALFAEGISAEVVGKPIDSLGHIGAVNGSSLTPNGFEAAVKVILVDAENA